MIGYHGSPVDIINEVIEPRQAFNLDFLDSGYEYETVYLAEQLLKFINGDFKYL